MGLVYADLLERSSLRRSHPAVARDMAGGSAAGLPEPRGFALLRPRGSFFSTVARRLLPAHDAPARGRRPKLFPAVRECLEVSRTDRDLNSLAKHERSRAALRRVQIAAVHGSGPSLGGVAAHKAARGSS